MCRPVVLRCLMVARDGGEYRAVGSCMAQQPISTSGSERVRVCRGVAQLVEHRSPKPGVVGSIPIAPATGSRKRYIKMSFHDALFWRSPRSERFPVAPPLNGYGIGVKFSDGEYLSRNVCPSGPSRDGESLLAEPARNYGFSGHGAGIQPSARNVLPHRGPCAHVGRIADIRLGA